MQKSNPILQVVSESGKVVELPRRDTDDLRCQLACLERQIEMLVDAFQAVRLRVDLIRLQLNDL